MKQNNKKLYILSFILPFMAFILYAYLLKIYPFGEMSAFFSDNANQFASFYTFFKNIFKSSNSNFLYTFSKTLGGDMVGFSAYYLQNPFLLLLFFVGNKYIPAALYFIEVLQLCLAGLTFQIFLVHAFKKGNLAFSTAYTLLGYALSYFMLPIYFCDLITLPLVVLGLHLIFENDSLKGEILYVTSLFLSVLFNYYIGYMICLFLFLYAVYLIFIQYDKNNKNASIKKIKSFASCSLISVCLSMFNLLPTLLSLSGQKSMPSAQGFSIHRLYKITDSFSKLFTASYDGNISNVGFPNIYIGIIPCFFALYFLLNKSAAKRERIASFVFIAIMILCLNISTLNTIWHGFNEPVGFAYRFAFLLSFFMLITGYKGYVEAYDKKAQFICFSLILIYAAYIVVFHKHSQPSFYIILDVIILLVVIILQRLTLKHINIIICMLCIAEIMLNGFYSMKVNVSMAKPLNAYEEQYERIDNIISYIKNSDDGFYRIEKDFQLNMQDALAFDYIGLTHNSSCETDSVKSFMENLGFRNQGIFAFYNQGSTTFADILLGVKYFVSRFDSTDKPYETFGNIGDDYIFKNTYALPLCFFADKNKAGNINMNRDDTFEIQNDIAKSLCLNADIYKKAGVESITTHNLCCDALNIKDYDCEISEANGIAGFSQSNEFMKINPDEPAYIEFNIIPKLENGILYFDFNAPKNQGGIRIYVNDADFDDYFTDWRFNVEKAGRFAKDSSVKIKLQIDSNDRLLLDDFYFYEEDLTLIDKLNESINENKLNGIGIKKNSASNLSGTFSIPKALDATALIFSIPYDEGWHVKIDGKRAETYKVLDTLLAVDISAADNDSGNSPADIMSTESTSGKDTEHTIEMYFIPKGLIAGSIISFITLIIIVIYFYRKRSPRLYLSE